MLITKKIDLRRRGSASIVTSTGLPTEWIEEEVTVDQNLINNRIINLLYSPINNSETVRLNGLVLIDNSGWDYTISSNVITFTSNIELTISDYIVIKYERLKI